MAGSNIRRGGPRQTKYYARSLLRSFNSDRRPVQMILSNDIVSRQRSDQRDSIECLNGPELSARHESHSGQWIAVPPV